MTVSADDIALLQYTGGTTGVSKGAMLTQRNVIANTMQILEWAKPFITGGEETVLTALPLVPYICSFSELFILYLGRM